MHYVSTPAIIVIMIISVLNQKGGVGKTTLSINLASAFAEGKENQRVLLIDTDIQKSALTWAAYRENPPKVRGKQLPKKPKLFHVYSITKPVIHERAGEFRRLYDHVIIDGPRWIEDTRVARSVIAAADLVLIPVVPSGLDIWPIHTVVKLIEKAQHYRPELQAAHVINRRQEITTLAHDTDEVMAAQKFRTLNSSISQRISVAKATTVGWSVYDLKINRQSAAEFTALKNEILEVMK